MKVVNLMKQNKEANAEESGIRSKRKKREKLKK
jgi:hypothetical protein